MSSVLLSWGRGRYGVLGHGHEYDVELPRRVSAAPPVISIACGELHTLALTADGRVLSWGSGLMGALGNGELGACRSPAEVHGLRAVRQLTAVAAGRHHSLALTVDGEVYGWGMCGSAAECVSTQPHAA